MMQTGGGRFSLPEASIVEEEFVHQQHTDVACVPAHSNPPGCQCLMGAVTQNSRKGRMAVP